MGADVLGWVLIRTIHPAESWQRNSVTLQGKVKGASRRLCRSWPLTVSWTWGPNQSRFSRADCWFASAFWSHGDQSRRDPRRAHVRFWKTKFWETTKCALHAKTCFSVRCDYFFQIVMLWSVSLFFKTTKTKWIWSVQQSAWQKFLWSFFLTS